MKNTLLLILTLITATAFGQIMPLTSEPDGGNLKASISQQIGIVKIAINYSRPA